MAEQQSTLRLDERCCTDLDALSFHAFDGSLTEFHVDSTTPVAEFRGNPTPALAVELPPVSADQVIEFFSFSDRERGLLRLTVHTFIRPDVVFLDAAGTVVGEHPAPVMCMGVKSGDIGLWARFPVPEGATRAVFLPSIAQPRQTVDTRTSGNQLDALGVGGRAIAEGIAESRQSYLSEASFTLMGRVGLERAAADSPDLGRRCRN
ncbi:MAG: hypothetical protein ACXIUZ_08785 [Lysobacteraceae bacterium]